MEGEAEKAQEELPWERSKLVSGDTTLEPVDNFFLLLRDFDEEPPSENFDRERLDGDSLFLLTAGDSGLDFDFPDFFLLGQERLERGGVQPRLDLSELPDPPPATGRLGATSC